VAGPRLAEAEPEAYDVAAAYQGAVVLVGREARSENVMRAVDGAGLAHFAAHGRFRADNPLFSALALVDGPLTVYDLERVEQVPRRVVLSACEIGLSAARPGEALMGLVSSLFALGSATLVASVVAVGDATTRPLMVEFHRLLAGGTGPAEALGCAQQRISGEAADAPFSAGFVCFGAG
jgi:CHAT domain-containing protein